MDPLELVRRGEYMAQALLQEARMKGVSYSDLLQSMQVAMRLMQMTYPGSRTDVFDLTQTADAVFDAVVTPPIPHN